jgi:hypothetical protein
LGLSFDFGLDIASNIDFEIIGFGFGFDLDLDLDFGLALSLDLILALNFGIELDFFGLRVDMMRYGKRINIV